LIRRNRLLLQRAEEARAWTEAIAPKTAVRLRAYRRERLNWYRDYREWLGRHAGKGSSTSD